jgi:hypothetical protein
LYDLECTTFLFEDRFDIEDRGAVDCLKTQDLQKAAALYAQKFGPVQSEGVGAVGGASRKDAQDRVAGIATGTHFEGGAARLVQPCQNPKILPWLESVKTIDKIGEEFEPRIRRSLPRLPGSTGALRKLGMYAADRRDIEISHKEELVGPVGLEPTTDGL